MKQVDIFTETNFKYMLGATLISLTWRDKDGKKHEAQAPKRGKRLIGIGLIRNAMAELWKIDKCRSELQEYAKNNPAKMGNGLYRYTDRKQPEAWKRYGNLNMGFYWLNEGQNHTSKILPLKKTLEICGVTSATLTYDDETGSLSGAGTQKTDSIPKTVLKHVNPYTKAKDIPFPRNRIIFGAPGTGKSFRANGNANYLLFSKCTPLNVTHNEIKEQIIVNKRLETAKKISEELLGAKTWCMERVTFHPEYSYYDFVGSYKPVMEDENIKYDFVPGPFARILVKALNDKEHPYLLLIEEINRARVAAVFGDIFQLLDRKENGESEYEIMPSLELARYLQNNPKLENKDINPIRIPNNLYIWATMNSADQGVYPLDTAFKRRWSMEYIPYGSSDDEPIKDEWNQIRTGINELLLEKGHVNEDKLMGYYFLKKEERTGDKLKDALQNKVLMYLFDDAAKHCRKEIFKIEGKDVITFSALQNKMRAAMKHRIDPNSNLGVFSEALQHPAAGNNG